MWNYQDYAPIDLSIPFLPFVCSSSSLPDIDCSNYSYQITLNSLIPSDPLDQISSFSVDEEDSVIDIILEKSLIFNGLEASFTL